ncbi:hypothetical protein [Candidatus Frankia alpina]|uniref:hypothetical protein n=1 Tax=Candidatus Frankia alpina TaxID=2699483 RepID=UPI001F32E86B|nr:hypothetical protein [Candidatus Frankia alpina]
MQRPEDVAAGHRPVGAPGLLAGTGVVDLFEGAQGRVELLDAAQEVLGDLHAGHLALADQFPDAPRRKPGEFLAHADRLLVP